MAPRSRLAALALVALAMMGACGCCGTGGGPEESPTEAAEPTPDDPPPVDQESDQYPSD